MIYILQIHITCLQITKAINHLQVFLLIHYFLGLSSIPHSSPNSILYHFKVYCLLYILTPFLETLPGQTTLLMYFIQFPFQLLLTVYSNHAAADPFCLTLCTVPLYLIIWNFTVVKQLVRCMEWILYFLIQRIPRPIWLKNEFSAVLFIQ